jgi:hypothetical protein
MVDLLLPLRLDQPATYKIVVQGRLDESWAEWFGGMTVHMTRENGSLVATTLTGRVRDQAELHGLLARTRDLCLPLLQVQLLHVDHPRNGGG